MKKQWRVILGIFVILLAAAVFVPQEANADSGYKRVKLSELEYMWDRSERVWHPTPRVKYGKYYYWAVKDGTDYDNGSGYSVYKIDYYRAKSKTGSGTKLFSSYETRGGYNDMLEFYTNGTYIIKTESSLKNQGISVCRYNMKGKNKKTLQRFNAGISSDVGKGFDSYCEVSILKVYGGKVYVSYHSSGYSMTAEILSFPVKKKKTAQTITTTYNYFSPAGKYIGFVGNEGTTIYNLKTGKTHKISSSKVVYLGRYKSKEYYYIDKGTEKKSIYRANASWKKRTKVGTIPDWEPFMKGKLIYFFKWDNSCHVYDIFKKNLKDITSEKYHAVSADYYARKPFKEKNINW
ncbi:MAG: hypothetical protein IJJ06_02960 [Mogibacterium sp.]|nr:hypothetical protein [Mogibacterium sp.]